MVRGLIVATALALLGCQAAPAPQPQAAAPPTAAPPPTPEPTATLHLVPHCTTATAAPSAVDVVLTFTPVPDARLAFHLGDRVFDAQGQAALIETPRAEDAQGPLPLVRTTSRTPDVALRAARTSSGAVTLRYRARSVPTDDDGGARFGLRHDPTGLSGLGAFFLVLPDPLPAPPRTVVSWSAGVCAGVSGHAPSQIVGRLDALRMEVYAFTRVPTRVVDRDGVRLRATWLGAPAFDVDEATDFAARAYAAERALFGDEDTDVYHVFARTLPVMGARSNGMGQPASMMLAIGPSTPGRPRLRINLAHELMHRWIGLRLRLAGPEGTAYWFTEGFTVYLTVQVLRRAELVTVGEVEVELAQITDRYFDNPRRAATNDQIRAGFFTDPALSVLPYVRGALYAAELDGAIRRASGDTRALDDLLRALLLDARDAPVGPSGLRELDDAVLRAAIARELGDAGLARHDAVIHRGARPEPASDIFGPCFARADQGERYRWVPTGNCSP